MEADNKHFTNLINENKVNFTFVQMLKGDFESALQVVRAVDLADLNRPQMYM